jgi:NitT/TauT family transport system permease protein
MDNFKNTKLKNTGFLFTLLSFALLIALWWTLAETVFKQSGVIPSPVQTLRIIGQEMQKESFSRAIFSTLGRSFFSFLVSFATAFVLALTARYVKWIDKLLNPFIVVFRSMPTIALVLILLLTVGSTLLPAVVAFLVVFPLCYENMRTAFAEVNPKLLTMAKVFKMPTARQVKGIYLPAMLPYIFSSIIAGFGLNIKVVISAEVMGLPTMSIGFLILNATQSFNFGLAFAWLVIAVILSLICEMVLKIIKRFCMPYKYPDLKICLNFANKVFKNKRKKGDAA